MDVRPMMKATGIKAGSDRLRPFPDLETDALHRLQSVSAVDEFVAPEVDWLSKPRALMSAPSAASSSSPIMGKTSATGWTRYLARQVDVRCVSSIARHLRFQE